MQVDAIIFEVSPLADPTRGGRWASVQLWDRRGSIPRQVAEMKIRLPEQGDVQPFIDDASGMLAAWADAHDSGEGKTSVIFHPQPTIDGR